MRSEVDAQIVDGHIVIRISIETLANAVKGSPVFEYYDDETENFLEPIVTDKAAFARDVVLALNRESEDGSTAVTEMFDKSFEDAAENGAEGIVFPDDDDYEAVKKASK